MSLFNNILNRFGYIEKNKFNELEKKLSSLEKNITRNLVAAQTSHLTSDWNDVYEVINTSLRKGIVNIRQRARDLAYNDPYAKKYLKMLEKNVIGSDGFILRNKAYELIYDESKGMKIPRYDKLANIKIQEAFEDWCKAENCTITEDITFRELNNIMIKTIATDGELLIKTIRDDSKYGYRLQLIEADYLDETYNDILPNGNIVVLGVELTPYRKPVAYWLKKINPYQYLFFGAYTTSERIRVPIYDSNGVLQIKHLFVKEHPSQIRGISWFAPSMIRLKILNGFEEAILVDARVSANKTIKYEYKDDAIGDEPIEANIAGSKKQIYDPAVMVQNTMPGEALIVPKGMTASQIDFKSPSGREGEFQKWALRGIASGFDVAFITLANNYEAVNYTSSRTNLLEERDTWKSLHAWFREHFLNWNFAEFLKMALLKQAINLPAFKYDKFNQPWFQGRSWQWVSPKDEAEAFLLLIQNGLGSLEEYLAERGWSLEAFIDQIKYEREAFEEAGLQFPADVKEKITKIKLTEPSNNDALKVN